MAALLEAWRCAEAAEQAAIARNRLRMHDGRFERAFALDLAVRLRVSPRTVTMWRSQATAVRDELPETWAVFQAGGTGWRSIQIVAQQADGLDATQRGTFDTLAAQLVQRALPGDLKRKLHDARERIAPEAAAERVAHATEHRGATVERLADGQAALHLTGPQLDIAAVKNTLHVQAVAAHGRDGETRPISALEYDIAIDAFVLGLDRDAPAASWQINDPDYWSTDAVPPVRADRAAARSQPDGTGPGTDGTPATGGPHADARAPHLPESGFATAATGSHANGSPTPSPTTGEPGTDERVQHPSPPPMTPLERLGGRDPRVPGRRAITATVLVTCPDVTATGNADLPGTLAGYGPLDPATVRAVVASTATWTRILTDPITGGLRDIDPTARYIPAALRKALWARDEVCRGMGCNHPAHQGDLDHVVRYEHGGPTSVFNLVAYCRRQHQIKDEGYWDTYLAPDGTLTWTSMWGARYVTTPAIQAQFEPVADPRPAAPPDRGAADIAGTDTARPDAARPDAPAPNAPGPEPAGRETAGCDTTGVDAPGPDTAGTATAAPDSADECPF